MSFDLEEFQHEVINTGRDLLSGKTSDTSIQRANAQLIRDMYWQIRNNNRLNKKILSALRVENYSVKEAALEIISEYPERKARDVLFIALEDETNPMFRQKIVELIDKIESKYDKKNYLDFKPEVSIVSALRAVRQTH